MPFDPGARRDCGVSFLGTPCDSCPVRSLTICAPLSDTELHQIAEITQTQSFGSHEAVFNEDEEATALYNITGGAVKLYKLLEDGRRQIMGFMFTGDFLGLTPGDRYSYTAETVTSTTVCRFPRTGIENLMEHSQSLQKRLFAVAMTDLKAAQEQMLLLGRKTAKEKIASFLLHLSDRARQRGQPDNPLFVPMGRVDIADFLGLTTETVSRTVTQLKNAGLIRLKDNSRIMLADQDGLRAIAGSHH